MLVPMTAPTHPALLLALLGLAATLPTTVATASAATIATLPTSLADPASHGRLWNPERKESPEPYGYDVYGAPDLPLGSVDPADPPATLLIVPPDPARAVLDVTTTLDRTACSWFGALTVTASVSAGGAPAVCDSVVAVSAANPRVRAHLRDDGSLPDLIAGDGVYTGVYDVGAGEGEARPTGSYTLTATAWRGPDLGQDASPSFSLYAVRRWTGITTSDLGDSSDDYTAFFAEPLPGGGFRHTIRDFGLIRSASVAEAEVRIPVLPATNTVTNLEVTGSGVSNVRLEGNVIAFTCDLRPSSVTRVNLAFDAPSDLAVTRIDRYQTGDIGLREFRNGYLVWNRYLHTAILGTGFTSPHGPGCIVDLHVTDLVSGDPHTVDCMERVAVHRDDAAVNDGTGTYPSNIKWQDDALAWPTGGDLDSFRFHFVSGGNYALQDEVLVEREVEFYAGRRFFRHEYRIENQDAVAHDFDFVWGREQWLYGGPGSNREQGDRGILPADPTNYGGEFRLDPTTLFRPWFAAFDLSSVYAIGVITPDEPDGGLPTWIHLLCAPALGNGTGEYPILPAGSCGNMENLFFERRLGVLGPGESATYAFYQWGGYAEDRGALSALLDADADLLSPDPASVDAFPDGGPDGSGGQPGAEPQGPGSGDPALLGQAVGIALAATVPNPVHGRAELAYRLPEDAEVALRAFDVHGRLVRTLVEESRTAGIHRLDWAGDDDRGILLPAGVYFLRLEAGSAQVVRKVTIER